MSSLTHFSFRKAALAVGTLAIGTALVAGAGIAPASAAAAGVTHIVLLSNDVNIAAGTSHSFTVLGEDADNNVVSTETGNSVLTSDQPDDVITGNSVAFGAPATHIITATDGTFSNAIAISVNPGPATEIRVTPDASKTALHSTIVFSTQSYDAHGYARGNATVTYKSSSTHDVIHGASITFGSYGTRTITVKSQSFTTTTTVSVGKSFKPTLKFTGTWAVGHKITSSFTGITGTGAVATRVWKRDGVAISGATGKTYTITSADAGHSITLTYTLSAKNYLDYTKTSKSHAIA